MEMLFTIMAGVVVGALVAKNRNEYEKIVAICFAGGAATALGLIYTLIFGSNVGTSASPIWLIIGVIGGIGGMIAEAVLGFALNRIVAMLHTSHSDESHESAH